MTKSDLIEKISFSQGHLSYRDVELSVKTIIEKMSDRLVGRTDKIRGWEFLSPLSRSEDGQTKNRRKSVFTAKHVPHFKPGKELGKVIWMLPRPHKRFNRF